MLTRRQLLLGAATVLVSAGGCARLSRTRPEVTEAGPRPFRVALLSDPHTLVSAGGNGKFSQALADYKPLRPDLWLVCGDITDGAQPAQYAAFKGLLKGTVQPEQLLVTAGNHDLYDDSATEAVQLGRFRDAFSLPTVYSNRVAGGLHFVMLAGELGKSAPGSRDWAWLSAQQLRWFDQVLAEHRDKPTVVALHQPLQDTVTWSQGGAANTFAGCGQLAELKAILKKNPQIKLWLSGHTHMGAAIAGNVVKKEGVTYVGLGSTCYQFVPSKGPDAIYGGFAKDLSACESRMLEVWPDRLVIKARNHAQKAWIADQELTLATGR